MLRTSSLIVSCLLGAALLTAPCRARADVVTLDNGRRIEGVIVSETSDGLTIASRGGRSRMARARIQTVEYEPPADNALRWAAIELYHGNPGAAHDHAIASLALGAKEPSLRAWCIEQSPTLGPLLRAAGPEPLAQWTELLRRLGELHAADAPAALSDTATTPGLAAAQPTSFSLSGGGFTTVSLVSSDTPDADASSQADPNTQGNANLDLFRAAAAAILATAARPATAGDFLDALQPASLRLALRDPLLRDLVVERVTQRLDENDFAHAARLVRRLEAAGLSVGEACRIRLLLRWSSFERSQGRYDTALRILKEDLEPLSPALAHMRLEETLTDARRRLAAQRRFEEAIALHLRWSALLAPARLSEVLADLHFERGDALLETNQPALARQAFQEAFRLRPPTNADEASRLARCDFQERFDALAPQDRASAFDLGRWAAEQGLLSHAITAYERAAAAPDLAEPARKQIAVLQERIALTHLERCMAWFEAGQPERALAELDKFPFYPAVRHLESRIAELRRVCYAEMGRRSGLDTFLAENLFENAQRLFLMGRTDDAVNDMTEVVRRYQATPAAQRARDFLRQMRLHADFGRLEGRSALNDTAQNSPSLPVNPGGEVEHEIARLLRQLETTPSGPPPGDSATDEH